MIRRPPRSTRVRSSAASDVYKRQVRIHPETSRKTIFLGERVRRFAGLTEEESRPLLDFLMQHAVRYEFTYRHRWQLNDMLMWDNASTLHIALSDYSLQRDPRLMFRCAVMGRPPDTY